MERVVVVGAGLAGGRAVVELREQGYTGRITVIGAEPHHPYDRPPLSKAVLAGRTDDTSLPFALHELPGVELLLGRRATALEPGVVHTDAGPVDYDGLVLATGSTPVTLPGTPTQRVLRTIDDSRRLREALRPGLRLVIVGAGWIGAEVATVAAKLGALVTVVEAGHTPLGPLGARVGAHSAAWYEQAGVTLRTSVAVEKIGEDGLLLAGGEFLAADEIVVGVGVRPDVAWLADSGLVVDRGVVVDGHLLASWAEGVGAESGPVVAVGDCAAWWSARYRRRMRVEHWDFAQSSPVVAVGTLLALAAGEDATRARAAAAAASGAGSGAPEGEGDGVTLPVYDPVPYFWSEQFGRMVQFAGLPADDATLVFRGDPAARPEPGAGKVPGWSAGWFAADGTLSALVTVARPIDMVAGRRLLAANARPDQARFADPAVSLRSLAE
jgi:3-phenylpropionate/trans-cinnamate dioxygenase ferredoxin reductase subunit